MLKKILITAAFFALPMLSVANEVKINNNAPETYIVEKGDTLWQISSIYLEQPWLWPKLWRLNPEINNPHLIYPGDVIRLVYDENGQPQLLVDSEPKVVDRTPAGKPTLKLGPTARKSEKSQPLTTLALHEIAPYIQFDNLLTQEQLDKTPYVVGSDEGYKSSLKGFKLYVNDNLTLGTSYAIYEKGEEIIDPETEESLGFIMNLSGTAQAYREGDMANKIPGTLMVDGSKREIHSGAYVWPLHEGQLFPAFFNMQKAASFVKGTIIKASTNSREFGKLEVILINRGSEHLIKQGDVMLITRQSPSVVESKEGPQYLSDASRWSRMANDGESTYNMPSEPIGQVMIFKVFDKASLALVLKTDKPARVLDQVEAP